MAIDVELLATELKRDEGLRLTVYKCSAGKQTIAYGHNLENTPISMHAAEVILVDDIAATIRRCESFPWFGGLSDVRKRVIINMCFNIGFTGVSRFKNMIAAIIDEDWRTASIEMMDSNWYTQVGARAERLCKMMDRNQA